MTPFSLLYVCTGNICRSPMAERLTRQRLDGSERIEPGTFLVSSAGTWGHEGSSMEPFAAVALLELGADPEGFVARELTGTQIEGADLVLTATVEQRGLVVGMVPGAVRRTFTLKEFARLVAAVEPDPPAPSPASVTDVVDRARSLVDQTVALRGYGPRAAPGADDVEDPYGAPLQVYREKVRDIAEAVDHLVAALVPS